MKTMLTYLVSSIFNNFYGYIVGTHLIGNDPACDGSYSGFFHFIILIFATIAAFVNSTSFSFSLLIKSDGNLKIYEFSDISLVVQFALSFLIFGFFGVSLTAISISVLSSLLMTVWLTKIVVEEMSRKKDVEQNCDRDH